MNPRLTMSRVFHAVCHASLVFLLGCSKPSEPTPKPPLTQTAAPWFGDATAATRLNFTHVAGTNWFMADQVGAGIVVQDFNNDGLPDVYCVQNGGPGNPARNVFWKQTPEHAFVDVSTGSGTDLHGRGMGAIAGDANNDGLADLVITEYGATRLLLNLGNFRFQDVSREAQIDNPRWAVPASFIDFDRDGRLDLVIGNYLDYDPTQVCQDVQGRRDFCSPEAFPPTVTRLFHNVTPKPGAPPRFEDVTEASGLTRSPGVALGLVCADFTGDGWPDIFCADDGRPNRLFVNRRNGTFTEEAAMRGLGFNAMGRTAANMGTAFADFDGDARGDIFVTHLTEEFHSLFLQDQPGLFRDAIGPSGLQNQAWRGTGFGTVAADFDNNGAPDIVIANGLVSRSTPGQTPTLAGLSTWWAPYAQKAQLFSNEGSSRFRDRSMENPALSGQAMVGRSLALLDLGADGALDLILGTISGPLTVLTNQVAQRGHWVQFRLIEPQYGGRDAIGAEIRLSMDNKTVWSVLQPATSYLASHEPIIHFGLGASPSLRGVEVRWADGTSETFTLTGFDRRWVLSRGGGTR